MFTGIFQLLGYAIVAVVLWDIESWWGFIGLIMTAASFYYNGEVV
jgi:hypothetical protein